MPNIDFISQLSGEEMDAALLSMATHEAERFARGTAAGESVNPGETGYEDNSKHYKNLAAGSAAEALLSEQSAAQSEVAAEAAKNAAETAAASIGSGVVEGVLIMADHRDDKQYNLAFWINLDGIPVLSMTERT